jgi:erythromycin esterase-like protein
MSVERNLGRALLPYVHPFSSSMTDFDPVLELVGDASCVLIGEATHGTHEFYRQRAQLTKRLIIEKGFTAVAVEADWPDAYRVNRYVRGIGPDQSANEALSEFQRFPTWMWRNADVLDFVGWLRDYNDALAAPERTGFYGLDLYSLRSSIAAVLAYLDRSDPAAAARARARYACFDRFGEDPQSYGFAAGLGLSGDCEANVVAELRDLHEQRQRRLEQAGLVEGEELFFAEQNARVVKDAEEYYRAMFQSPVVSWNLRDRHMASTLDALLEHLRAASGAAKLVVWAHNSHVGDARATELAADGELNVGQLARERHGESVRLIGFSTYEGTVTAASAWDEPAQRMRIVPGLPGSCEALFHTLELPAFLLRLDDLSGEVRERFQEPRLERAIGVVYKPETERRSHYYHAALGQQFDAVIHIDHTRALEPLERAPLTTELEAPETFPSGL